MAREILERNVPDRARSDLRSELRQAVERQEFLVEYQPVIELRTGAVRAVEALVRWRHPVRGTIPPAEFLPLAEETGDIRAIGEWVLRRACTHARAWQLASPRDSVVSVSVNLSARQLQDPNAFAVVDEALTQTELPAQSLVLELTGGGAPESVLPVLEELRSLGVGLALDDFGGQSTLADLRRLPVDLVKLERSFVVDAAGPPRDSAFVEALLGIAQARDLGTVAKGVETREQARRLQALGCDMAQGYLYSKPLGTEGIAALLSRGRTPGLARSR